jgi:hypothetical protein
LTANAQETAQKNGKSFFAQETAQKNGKSLNVS